MMTRPITMGVLSASVARPSRALRLFVIVVGGCVVGSGCGSQAVTKSAPSLNANSTATAETSSSSPKNIAASETSESRPRTMQGAERDEAEKPTGLPEHREGHQRMLVELATIRERATTDNLYLQTVTLQRWLDQLRELPPNATADQICDLKQKIADDNFRLGREQDAIDGYRAVCDLLPTTAQNSPVTQANALLALGLAHLRMAETQNCCQRYTVDSCVFPIQGTGVHQHQQASRAAIACFEQVANNAPKATNEYLSSVWLLNIAYMTVGGYPDQVPAAHRIPPENIRSEIAFPRFTNVSTQVGVGTLSLAGGVVADDFDRDGYIDLLVSCWDPSGQLRLHKNLGNGHFADVTAEAGLMGLYGGLNMVQADYDNDGDIDVFVLRGAWLGRAGKQPNSLLQNQGDGTFEDVTYASGLGVEHYPTQTAAWADYDNDGDLDLYIGNEHRLQNVSPCELFRNNGDGTFTDVAIAAGVSNLSYAKSVVWGDYDSDRWPDLYVSNFGEPNRLYHNNGDGTFTDVAARLGVVSPVGSFPSWFWDVDNDGDQDLFVSAYNATIAHLAAAYLGKRINVESARLYQNNDGRFVDVSGKMNLGKPNAPMGANFGDLDNDGFLDFYLGTGYPDNRSLMPNVMYWNQGGQRFADVTVAGGFGVLQKGHAIAFADFDHDGDQDVFEQMGGALPGDPFVDALYRNPGFKNHWVSLELEGTKSNRSAIGARIRVDVVDGNRQRRSIYKYVNSGGSFGANPLRQTLGLGSAKAIDVVEVFWPTSAITQRFTNVQVDQHYTLREDATSLQRVDRPSYEFGQ